MPELKRELLRKHRYIVTSHKTAASIAVPNNENHTSQKL
jgi:hypothetical protein